MDCPYCKKEMQKGDIYTNRPLQWIQADVEEYHAVTLAGASLMGINIESCYCPDCHMMILPVPEQKAGFVDKLKNAWQTMQENRKEESMASEKQREEEKEQKRKAEQRKKDPWEV